MLSTLLDEALELPDDAHATWLQQLGPEFASVRPALQEMLARRATRETADLVDRLPAITLPDVPFDAPRAFVSGGSVGPYRLLRLLGQGGMGVVWLAERIDGLVKRDIALKLLHVSGASWALAERFARGIHF